ncbi:WG repeat-containing protein, partial [Arcobacteraceae bacterium]|nr:WG repeat-containing protein [Arcobacteraceae bacterium]
MKKIINIVVLLSIVFLTGCSTKIQNESVITINSKEGLLKENGEIAVKPVYKSISSFEGDDFKYQHPNNFNIHWIENNFESTYAVVSNEEGKFGIINKEGELLIKPIYDSIGRYYNGFAKIELNNKFGLINEDFDVSVKPIYDEALEFVYDTIIVKKFNKYGCIDKNL